MQQAPRGGVPDLDGVVPASRGQPLAVPAERHVGGYRRVAGLQDAEFLAGGPIPDADGTVAATRGEVAAVGAEGDPEDWPIVVLEGLEFLRRRHIPDAHGE